VSLLFQDDGVWQLVADQQGHAIGKRTLGSQLQVLPLYDVERLYADAISLQERQIDAATLSLPVTILDTNALKQLIAEQNQLMRL
jgi:tRNA 2-thiouridine synthesizing protein C